MARIGIIGTGWGSRVQVPAFREAGHRVVAIAGRDAEKTRSLARELDVAAVDDWRALLERELDLVTIVTPPSEHLAMATAALEAGHHVLSEKPTALDAAEARQLVECAASHPQQLALIDHELRFLPSWVEARERVKTLGGVRYVEMRYASPGRGDRNRAWNWWSDAAHGGGVWGAIGSHLVDATRYLVGEIESVTAMLRTAIADRPHDGGTRAVTSDDVASVTCMLTDGALVAMTMSVVAGVDEPTTITIHGERGSLRLVDELLLAAPSGGRFEQVAGSPLAARAGNSAGGAFGSGTVFLGQALLAAIDGGLRAAIAPAATFVDGLEQQKVLDAARRSAREGRTERVR